MFTKIIVHCGSRVVFERSASHPHLNVIDQFVNPRACAGRSQRQQVISIEILRLTLVINCSARLHTHLRYVHTTDGGFGTYVSGSRVPVDI